MLSNLNARLEEVIYSLRSKLRDDETFAQVASESERGKLVDALGEDEEWLYDEGFNAN